MASYTTNLNLEMPTVNEKYDVLKQNANWQKVDDYAGTVNEQIATLNDNLNNDTLAFPTAGTSVTIDAGGYCVIGKLVIVNLRLTTSASISSGYLVTGLPHPKPSNNKNYVPVYGYNVGNQIFITSNGEMQVNETIGAGMIMVSASYMI